MSSVNPTASNQLFSFQLQKLIPYYLLILAVTIFYSNIYDNAFLYDDQYLILENSYLHGWHFIGKIFQSTVASGAYRIGYFYRPLQNLLYLITYQAAGPSLFAFHLLNVSLHATNACLAFTLARKMNFSVAAAFLGALIWCLHPIQTEAVTYMSATADVLYVFFCLSGLIVLLPDFTARRFLIATPLFVLGLLSKETAIVFPLLLMACMYGMGAKKEVYLSAWPLWAIALLYITVRFFIMPFHGDELLNIDANSKRYGSHILIRIWTFLATLPAYFQLLIRPIGLHMDRDFPAYFDPWQIEVYTGGAILLAMIMQIIRGERTGHGKPLSWGFLWFAAAEIPQTGILIPLNSLFLEHWMYLPSLGLILGLAQTIAEEIHQPTARRLVAAVALAAALTCGCLTYRQNEIWHDPITFYHNILDQGETSARAHNNLGLTYMEKGDYEKAMEQFQLATKVYDITPETHQNIAALLSEAPDGKPHIQEEIDELNKAIAIAPNFWNAYEGLATLYAFKGDKEKEEFYRHKVEVIRSGLNPP